LLDFAGIAPPRVAALPIAQHFAEKVHAYTLPRTEATNTRVKDLVDLVLLIDTGSLHTSDTVRAIRATFQRRNTHEIPRLIPVPPDSWRERYDSLAAECGVSAQTAQEAYEIISSYWKTISKELFAQ
jgi:hypothetical protein